MWMSIRGALSYDLFSDVSCSWCLKVTIAVIQEWWSLVCARWNFVFCGSFAVHTVGMEWLLYSEGRSTSTRHEEPKSHSRGHHSAQSTSRKDHRDELASSSGSLSKQVYMLYLYDCFLFGHIDKILLFLVLNRFIHFNHLVPNDNVLGCRILPTQPHMGPDDFQVTCSIKL